jgi:hypothetical protein
MSPDTLSALYYIAGSVMFIIGTLVKMFPW